MIPIYSVFSFWFSHVIITCSWQSTHVFYSRINPTLKSWTIIAIIFLERKSNQINKKIQRWKKIEWLRNSVERSYTILIYDYLYASLENIASTLSYIKDSDLMFDFKSWLQVLWYKWIRCLQTSRRCCFLSRSIFFHLFCDYNYCFYISSTRLYKEKFITSIYTCASCTWST